MTTDYATVGRARYKALGVDDAREMSYVDERRNYRVVIQLGPLRSFRTYQPGQWKLGEPLSVNQRGQKVYQPQFKPAIHETGPVTGKVANGLISAHNQWLKDNLSQEPAGNLNRQLLVLSVSETDEVPQELMSQVGLVPANMVQAMVETILRQRGFGGEEESPVAAKRRSGRAKAVSSDADSETSE